ncbi:MAG: O-antigen ligase family protein [Candidatus Hydrogenedentes bacterium]|nr:O-antigen ligase family protein [Candidatus Hydrogenedentota bacterium]
MAARSNLLQQTLRTVLFPATERDLLGQQIILVSLVVVAVCALGPVPALILAAALVLGTAFVFAPSRWVILIFILFMGFTHQMRSFATVHAGGVEWHPRELLLFGLLAHGTVKLLQGRARPIADPIHFFVLMLGFYFVQVTVVGILHQYDLHLIIAEMRNPCALASYVVLVFLAREADLSLYVRAFFVVTMTVATIAIAYFLYTFVTGHVINVQNVWGEYVPRQLAGRLVQSVRPSGHVYYEVTLTVLASFAIGQGVSMRRRAYLMACIALFAFAIAITFMRTAYVSAFVSLAILAWLALPGWQTRAAVAGLGVFALVAALVLVAGPAGDLLADAVPALGTSIRARFVEMEGAYRAFQRHPGIGAGMGSTFEALGLASKTSQIAYAQTEYQTVHNTWMYYLFKGGVFGAMLVLLGFGGIFVEMCRRLTALADWRQRCLMRGIAAAYCGQMIACLAMPRLLYAQGYVFVAMTAAFTVLITLKPVEEPLPRRVPSD